MIGKTLAHYEITSQIGKGGMGEVYQAKDQKLGRDVAIKVLPEEFAKDADRVSRLQREAKLLASLNHPNIAAIHGLEETDGTNFLVMELIEGDTLADRIRAGAIPVEEALKLALQIAEALEAAHEKGVIHRDLKPANIKVTPDGKVKVLDFGLAKAFAGEQSNLNLSNSPTLSDIATQQGLILGTAAYMSPEQARGKPVDKRTDVWAFGCVLFEILTGKAAFSGRDVTDVLAAVIRANPEWESLPANLHWRLMEVLERCLEKEAKDRYHDIADVRVDIQKVLADPGGIFIKASALTTSRTKMRTAMPWIVTVLGIIIVGVVVWSLRTPEPPKVIRLYHDLPEDQELGQTEILVPMIAVSPDGRQFVYCTSDGLYLGSVDAWDSKLIPGTNKEPYMPFFSPDGQSIGFASGTENKLMKIAPVGGTPVPLCDIEACVGASWGADGTIVFGDFGKSIMRVSANGGMPKVVINQSEGDGLPQILPDGKSVLYTSPMVGNSKIMVGTLESGEAKELFAGESARYLPTGHITYVLENNLYAIPFDLDTLNVTGEAVSMLEGIYQSQVTNVTHYAISNSGTLIYLPGKASGSATERTFMWVNMEGKEEPLNAPPNLYRAPKVSPDGTKVATSATIGGNQDIYIWENKTLRQLTFDEADDSAPLWTPDGKRIVFWSNRQEPGIYWKNADGTGKVEPLFALPDLTLFPWSWSNDGNTLVFMEYGGGLRYDISVISMKDDRAIKSLLKAEYAEGHPRISPDGRYMAYMSLELGQMDIYVCPFPDVESGAKWKVSTTVGESPLWSPDGNELFYLSGDAIMAIPVNTKSTFSYETPRKLFSGNFVTGYGESPAYDIHPTEKRFLMMKSAGGSDDASTAGVPRKINIVLNWFEELKQKAPGD